MKYFLLLDKDGIVMAKRNLTESEMADRMKKYLSDAAMCVEVTEEVYNSNRAGQNYGYAVTSPETGIERM